MFKKYLYNFKKFLVNNIRQSTKVLIFNILIIFKSPYPRSYFFIMQMLLKKKLIPIINSTSFNKKKMIKVYEKIMNIQNKAIVANAVSPHIYLVASSSSLLVGKIDEWINQCNGYIKLQKSIFKTKKKKGYNFQIIEPGLMTYTIGANFTLDAWIKSQILGFQEKTRLILPILPSNRRNLVNRCMIDYYKPYIDIIEDPDDAKYYYSLIEECQAPHNVYIPCGNEFDGYYTHSAAVYIQSIWDKQGRKPLFEITDEHRERGQAVLRKMGLPKDAWFVVCHVREGGFKGEENFRDSNIFTYLDSFEEITKRGGWVIRMGDSKMAPIPSMQQVVDYANSEYKNDWMDIFLCGSAKFMIGTSSGLYTVSSIFGVPVVQTNSLPAAGSYLTKKGLFIPRLMRRKEDGQMLNLTELMTSPYNMGCADGMYDNIFRVEVIPNTSWEIKNICIEMINILDGSIEYSENDEKLQEIFKRKTAAKEAMIGFPNTLIPSRIGKDFLNKHRNLLIN